MHLDNVNNNLLLAKTNRKSLPTEVNVCKHQTSFPILWNRSSVNNREPFYSPQKGFIQELRH